MVNSANNNKSNSRNSGVSVAPVVATQLPGIDNSQVISSQPYIVNEGSSKVQHKEIKLEKF